MNYRLIVIMQMVVLVGCNQPKQKTAILPKHSFSQTELSMLFDSSSAYFLSLDSIKNFEDYKKAKGKMYQLWSVKGHESILRPTFELNCAAHGMFVSKDRKVSIQLAPLAMSLGGGAWPKKPFEMMSLSYFDTGHFYYSIKNFLVNRRFSKDTAVYSIGKFLFDSRYMWMERQALYAKKLDSKDRPFNWETAYQPVIRIYVPADGDFFWQIPSQIETIGAAYILAIRRYSFELFDKPIDSLNNKERNELREKLPLNIRLIQQ